MKATVRSRKIKLNASCIILKDYVQVCQKAFSPLREKFFPCKVVLLLCHIQLQTFGANLLLHYVVLR